MNAARRDLSAETRWLECAEHDAGRSGFVEHVAGRLAAGDAAYGDRWSERSVDELLVELSEESADLGGWGVLALQALSGEPLCDASRRRVATRLERAIALAARAHHELVRARLELRRAPAQGTAGAQRPRSREAA